MALTKISGSVIKDSVSLSGNVSIGGTLTYQDVTNVDALGVGTFRSGIKVLAGGINVVGVSTFAGNIDANNGISVSGDNLSIAAATDIRFTNSSGTWTGSVPKIQHYSDRLYIVGGSEGIRFREGPTDRWDINGDGHFVPRNDSQLDIGTNTIRVRNGYFDTLYGDGSQLTGITGTTINNNANNRVITGSGSANTLEGESSFTYDGNGMAYITGTGAAGIAIQSPDTTDTGVYFSDGANTGAVTYLHTTNTMRFRVNGQNRLVINSNGTLDMPFDNAKLRIGAGNDLKLYHDGSNSYIDNATNILWIRNQTTGSSIYMRSDELLLQTYTDNPVKNYIVATRGGDVKLYHNGTHMFQTTSTGVNVQSSGSSHGLTVTHSNGNVVASLHNKGSGDEGYLALRNGGTDTIKLDGEHGRLEGTETKTLNTPRVLVSVNLATNSNHSAYGVQTVYHYGSGVFQVVFAANMPNANYVTTASAVGSVNGDGMVVAGIGGATNYRDVGSLRMRVSYCTNNAGNDVTNVNLAFFTNA